MAGRERSGLMKAFLAGIGLADAGHRWFSTLYDELVERGRLKSAGSNDYLLKALKRARGEREDIDEIAMEILRDAARTAGLASQSDLRDMEMRLESLEEAARGATGAAPEDDERDCSIREFSRDPADGGND